MKLMSFEQRGRQAWGVVRGEEVVDLSGVWPDLRTALEDGVGRIAQEAGRAGMPCTPLAGLQWLPPVPNPRKILCVGLNYGRHVLEAGRELPAHPSLFIRYADSFVGNGQDMWKPRASDRYDYEGELAVVIGRAGRHIAARDALSHVAGYTCMAENSVRDFQKHNAQVTPGKNFERSGALGPWLVTADEICDPARLRVMTRLNGETLQQGEVSDLIFPIAELIAYISAFTPVAGRRDRHRHAGGRGLQPQAAALHGRGRRAGSGHSRRGHAGQPGDGRARPGTSRTRRRAWLMRCCT